MKYLLTFLICLSFSANLFSQNLTLSEVLSVRNKSLGEAEEFLTQKGWSFIGAEKPTNKTMGSLNFAYNVSNYDNKAESFILYIYSDYSNASNRLSIQLVNNKKYIEYLNQIKSWGGKMIDSYVKDENIYKIYQGTTITYVISSYVQEDDYYSKKTGYNLLIMTNESFEVSSYNDYVKEYVD